VTSNAENPATARNAESIGPNPTPARRLVGRDRRVPGPETRNRTAIELLAATVVKSATAEVLSVGRDQAVPVETAEPRDAQHRVTIERLGATTRERLGATTRDLLVRASSTESRQRHARLERTNVTRDRPSVRGRRAPTAASTPIRAIADRVCRRETARPVAHASNVGPAN
jgi:hypothetical protein